MLSISFMCNFLYWSFVELQGAPLTLKFVWMAPFGVGTQQPVCQNAAALKAICNNWQIQKKKIVNFFCVPAIYLLTNEGCFYLSTGLQCATSLMEYNRNKFWGNPWGFSEFTKSITFSCFTFVFIFEGRLSQWRYFIPVSCYITFL